MKVIIPVILLIGCLVGVPALPANPKPISDDVEIIPPARYPYGDQPVVDTGIIGFGGPFSNPFSGLLENLESMMTRLRQQTESLFRRLPGLRGNETEPFPDIPLPEGALGVLPDLNPFDGVDLGKGNTTSVTKIINGHKVVINETEYKKGDEFGQAFFKVRIIDVKPNESDLTTNKDAEEVTPVPAVKDREPLENSMENEIVKSNEAANFDTLEPLDFVDSSHFVPAYRKNNKLYVNSEWDDLDQEPLEILEDNSLNFRPIDLSRDTYVNEVLANAGAPTNPDAEVFLDSPQTFVAKQNRFRSPR